MADNPSCILPNALYLGDLVSAIEPKHRAKHKITHIVSIVQDWPSNGPHHLTIDLDDTETENLLAHLPRVCDFIDEALASGGVVLVHCYAGISRSASCVIAYMMRKNNWKLAQTIKFVRERRCIIEPNDGFLYQLQVFERCGYTVAEDHPTYISWKRAYDNAIANSEPSLVHIIPAIEDRVYFSSGFPSRGEDVKLILGEHAITHIVCVAPTDVSPLPVDGFSLHQVEGPTPFEQERFLVSLPDCVEFTHAAVEAGGRVLVHSISMSRASIVLCAYLIATRKMSVTDAAGVLTESIPFFNLTKDTNTLLDLYGACEYRPTKEHALVQDWVKNTPHHLPRFQRHALRVVFKGPPTESAPLDASTPVHDS